MCTEANFETIKDGAHVRQAHRHTPTPIYIYIYILDVHIERGRESEIGATRVQFAAVDPLEAAVLLECAGHARTDLRPTASLCTLLVLLFARLLHCVLRGFSCVLLA